MSKRVAAADDPVEMPSSLHCLSIALALCSLLTVCSPLWAQEMEPRAYSNAPVGMNFLGVGYGFSRGNIVTDPSLPIEDFRVTAHTTALGYVRTLGIAGKQTKLQATLPFAWLSGGAKIAGRDSTGARTGLADPRLKVSMNLVGGPALAPGEFATYRQDTILGASIVLSFPFGQYDASKRVNLGSHRWGIKPELGISHRLGSWYAELYSGVWFFADNDEYLESSTLSQEPLLATQAHLSYVFRPGLWLAAAGVHVRGGEASIDGESQHSFQKNWRFSLTCAYPLAPQHGLKFVFDTGVATRLGADFDSITAAYQYSWF